MILLLIVKIKSKIFNNEATISKSKTRENIFKRKFTLFLGTTGTFGMLATPWRRLNGMHAQLQSSCSMQRR